MYGKETRINGGRSFADAMLRFNASPQEYALLFFNRVTKKMHLDPSDVKYFATEDFFMLAYQKIPFIVEDFSFVELKKSEGVHAFEEWLSKTIFQEIREK